MRIIFFFWQYISNKSFDKTLQERLIEGYDVWIYPAVLVPIQSLAQGSCTKLYRGLLKHFLGDELANLSSKKIPEDVKNASLGN